MLRFPVDLLAQPPEEAARRVALKLLKEAASALSRIEASEDEEALHDFRVSLRRLRSCLRAYLPHLKRRPVERGLERIRRLANRTNAARDYEVHIEWLAARRAALRPNQVSAALRILRDLEACKANAYATVLDRLQERFARLEAALRPRLEGYRAWIPLEGHDPAPNFAEVSAELLQQTGAELRTLLEELRSPPATPFVPGSTACWSPAIPLQQKFASPFCRFDQPIHPAKHVPP